MTSVESYQLRAPQDLIEHLNHIEIQSQQALEHLNSLQAQRCMVLEALGIAAIDATAERSIA